MNLLINKKYYNYIYLIAFSIYLIAGILVHDNFGITWDEFRNKDYALKISETWHSTDYNQVIGDGESHAASRGALYLIALNKIESFFVSAGDVHKAYSFRRIFNHLFFIVSALLFLLFLRRIFYDDRFVCIALFMYLLMPRVYSHSFYNPVDIPLLCFFTFFFMSLYTLNKSITFSKLIIHSVLCAIVMHLRTVGEISLLITFFLLIFKCLKLKEILKYSKLALFYLILTLGLYVLITPFLWSDFLQKFVLLHNYSLFYKPVIHQILYLGDVYQSIDLPWHYTIVWMSITLPSVYMLAFLFSFFYKVGNLKACFKVDNLYETLVFSFIVLLLIAASVFNYSKYNDWRHFYFLYPAIILLTVLSLSKIKNKKAVRFVFAAFIVQFVITAYDMFIFHPHQITYFNRLSGGIKSAEGRFPLDYFGSSFRQSLELIALNDPSESKIRVAFYPHPIGLDNLVALPYDLRRRFEVVVARKDADYLMTKWVFSPHLSNLLEFEPYLYKSIKVNDVSIHNIYRLK